jgi:hypothetical protein
VPFVRSFVQKTGTDFEARQNFYENRDSANAALDAYEAMNEKGMTEEAEKFYQKNEKLIMLSQEFKPYGKMIKDYNQMINTLKKEKDERFNDEIERLIDERTQIMREFNKRFGEEMYKPRKNTLKNLLRPD